MSAEAPRWLLIRPESNGPPCPDVAHKPALLLLRHEHVPSVAGAHVSVLGRGFAEIVEHENPQRRAERAMRRLAFGHIAANVNLYERNGALCILQEA
jgi:hypothetical protein